MDIPTWGRAFPPFGPGAAAAGFLVRHVTPTVSQAGSSPCAPPLPRPDSRNSSPHGSCPGLQARLLKGAGPSPHLQQPWLTHWEPRMRTSARALASLLLALLLTSSLGALGVRPGLVARITAKGLECGKARWPSLGRLTRSAPGCSGHGRGTQARFLGPGWDSGPRRPTSVSLRHLLVLAGFPPADETGLGCKCLVWEMIPGHTLGERKCEAGKEGRHTLRSAPVRYLVHVIPPF